MTHDISTRLLVHVIPDDISVFLQSPLVRSSLRASLYIAPSVANDVVRTSYVAYSFNTTAKSNHLTFAQYLAESECFQTIYQSPRSLLAVVLAQACISRHHALLGVWSEHCM
eukprot:620040-Pleurochrysis_carterae.AAC.1